MARRLRAASLVAVVGVALSAVPTVARGGATLDQSGYYQPCGTFSLKGSHKLFRHALSCTKATRKAKYVLKHRSAPAGWKCSLNELGHGFAACQRGQKAWEFVPA